MDNPKIGVDVDSGLCLSHQFLETLVIRIPIHLWTELLYRFWNKIG